MVGNITSCGVQTKSVMVDIHVPVLYSSRSSEVVFQALLL